MILLILSCISHSLPVDMLSSTVGSVLVSIFTGSGAFIDSGATVGTVGVTVGSRGFESPVFGSTGACVNCVVSTGACTGSGVIVGGTHATGAVVTGVLA